MTRVRLALVVCAVAILAFGATWAGLHTRLRLAYWDRVAARPLTDDERDALEACHALGWPAITKIVEQDLDVPCGEPWLVEGAAAHVAGSADRTAWLTMRAADAVRPRQFRAALLLAAAGETAPVEPALLLLQVRDELPAERVSALLLAAGEGVPWADALGPRGVALGRAAAANEGRISVTDALPSLRWLGAVGDPEADRVVAEVASTALGVDDTWLATVREREATGRSDWQLPDPWRVPVRTYRDCAAGGCSALWLELLTLPASEDEEEAGPTDALPAVVAPGDARLDRVARLAGASDDDIEALAWGFERTAAWVAASPERASRLASLLADPPSPAAAPFARTLWDGAGAPFGAAVVAMAVGRAVNVPVVVRSNGDGTVWIGIGDQDVPRARCGEAPAGPPPTAAWPAAAVEAAALSELAVGAGPDGPRLAGAAGRLDPLVAEGLVDRLLGPDAPRDLHVGREVGAAVGRSVAPPAEVERERRQFAATLRSPCDETVNN